jgi:hypothetical protein
MALLENPLLDNAPEQPKGPESQDRAAQIKFLASLHGSLLTQRGKLNLIAETGDPDLRDKAAELVDLLDEFNSVCAPYELADAMLARRLAEQQAAVAADNAARARVIPQRGETLNGAAIMAMSRLIRAEQRAAAILLLSSEKLLVFATDGDDGPAEVGQIAIGLHAAALAGNDELQALIVEAEALRLKQDAHVGTSDELRKCLFNCEFSCDGLAELLQLISHTWHEMAKSRVHEDRMLRGRWLKMVQAGVLPEEALSEQTHFTKSDVEKAYRFSLVIDSAADELRDAFDAAWEVWKAFPRTPAAPALKEAA